MEKQLQNANAQIEDYKKKLLAVEGKLRLTQVRLSETENTLAAERKQHLENVRQQFLQYSKKNIPKDDETQQKLLETEKLLHESKHLLALSRDEIKRMRDTYERELASLQKQLNEKKQECISLALSKASRRGTPLSKQAETKMLQQELNTAIEKIMELETTVYNLQKEVDYYKRDSATSRSMMEKRRADTDKLLSDMQQKLDRLKQRLESKNVSPSKKSQQHLLNTSLDEAVKVLKRHDQARRVSLGNIQQRLHQITQLNKKLHDSM